MNEHRSPGRQNAVVLGIIGAISAVLLVVVVLAISTDGTSSGNASGGEGGASELDPRDQSIYDDGYRAGTLAAENDRHIPAGSPGMPDTTSRCNGMTQEVQIPHMGARSHVRVELYDYDDITLWVTGCVEGYEAKG
ncbi:hypothetical protein [Gordonia sp. 'Campus']|uniref:hypothetical protein n=1 Tax=Gordonia sp. 'Campus' TaxID=2915824 RepID=UPI001EE4B0A8|nr:hypothetical protein [Gordonia sp. 'Campus']